jgi:hypothetical protein
MVSRPAKELRGARMKLQRAEEHFGELATDHQRFLDRNPYRVLRETDGRDHCFAWRVKIVEEPPLAKWASLVGECVHALRSALDHTAYELVRLKRSGAEFSEFPIFKDRGAWDAKHAKKLPGVDPKVLTQVKWLQPYRRGEQIDPLWVVHRLDILDKHRRLNVVTATLEDSAHAIEGGKLEVTDWGIGPFEDGAILGRFRIDSEPGAGVRMQTQFVFGIALAEGQPWLTGQSLIPALEWLRVYTGGVVASFDRFFG